VNDILACLGTNGLGQIQGGCCSAPSRRCSSPAVFSWGRNAR